MTTKFKETEIRISFFFGLTVALMGIFDKTGTVFMCLLSGILHESGHLAALLFFRERPKGIHITPFGVRIERYSVEALNTTKEILCAAAGPFVNFLLFLVFYKTDFSQINLVIGLLNLLPCAPLDGSRITEGFLKIKFSPEKSEKISFTISLITVAPVLILGIIILVESRYNFSLLLISFYIIFFIIIKKKNRLT